MLNRRRRFPIRLLFPIFALALALSIMQPVFNFFRRRLSEGDHRS
jgi:hypothetical protein